jgi:YVTN family beta-propeller protein
VILKTVLSHAGLGAGSPGGKGARAPRRPAWLPSLQVELVSGTIAAGVVTPVDTRTHIAGPPILIGGGAQSIAVTPNGKTVYVPNGVLNTVTPITTATNTARPPIPVGGEPFALVVTPNGRRVYVGNTNSNSVTPIRVSTNSPQANIPVGNAPNRVVITPDGKTVYTVNDTDNTVTPVRVSTNTAGRPYRSVQMRTSVRGGNNAAWMSPQTKLSNVRNTWAHP